jgi:uncharacterized protein
MKPTYLNPYLAGVLLGLVLLASFIIAGRGIGASGVTSQVLAHGYETLGATNQYLEQQKSNSSLSQTWIVLEVVGIFIGALLSAYFAGRFKKELVCGSTGANRLRRVLFALGGGILMGFAARLARGCTSGQALSGGALLSAGSWVFMLAIFVGAYLAILFVKKEWQ